VALDRQAAWRAWRSFDGVGALTQAFLLARMAVAPLGPLEQEWRGLHGRVLSLGCGHGAVDRYVAELNPSVHIEGVDLDEGRVKQACETQDRAPRVVVSVADVTTLDPGEGYDAALAIDVLHHVPADAHGRIAAALHRALKPGGVCLVKEMAPEPRRQYLWNRTHDRIVAGPDPIHCRMPEDMAGVLRGAGFEIEDVRRVKRLGIYPQYLVRARRSAQAA
jgi:cyclopropane fatty-acyl-phospholipid synthase-like methyltransferase